MDRILMGAGAFILAFSIAFFAVQGNLETFAEGEGATGAHFVTFRDTEMELTVKTKARTVGEALGKAGIIYNEMDKIEPEVKAEITGDTIVNILRARPVVVKDGLKTQYLLTTDIRLADIAEDAGMGLKEGDEIYEGEAAGFLEVGFAKTYEISRAEVEPEPAEEIITPEMIRVGTPLTARMGVNWYTVEVNGAIVQRKETFYDLPMSGVMMIAARECGVEAYYEVREDGVKVDAEGYVLVAAELSRYPRCTVVETSLGLGRVYDTGGFAVSNPEQFDLATDWSNWNGK